MYKAPNANGTIATRLICAAQADVANGPGATGEANITDGLTRRTSAVDFAMLPPEINSGRMYSGPGSGPMLAAASAWDNLAADLHATAASYEGITSGLTNGPWLGGAAASMATAVTPYIAWLSATATQAELTAVQAKSAAAAYQNAFALTVPPPAVTANRVQLSALIATNLLGQNTAAIAITEERYAQMWVQDATAMYGYAGHSAAASTLAQFTAPPNTTNQAAAATAPVGAAGNHASAFAAAVPHTLQALTGPQSSTSPLSEPTSVLDSSPLKTLLETPSVTSTAASSASTSASSASVGVGTRAFLAAQALSVHEEAAGVIRGAAGGQPFGSMVSATTGGGGPSVAAGLGRASTIGRLSVPQGWLAAAPEARLAAAALPLSSASSMAAASASGGSNLLSEMALAGMAGRALGGTPGAGRNPERTGPKGTIRSVAEIAAGLRELGELRESHLLTDEEFTTLKQRLLGF